jgi:uncharacterized protein YgfB (UPF0149 family)
MKIREVVVVVEDAEEEEAEEEAVTLETIEVVRLALPFLHREFIKLVG